MAKPHKAFAKLAQFSAISYDLANERFHLDASDDTPPDGFGIAVSDAFGEDPEHVFFREGDVKVAGDLAIGATGDYAGVYVIDGNLEVDGLLDFTQIDGAAILLVTGNLKAKNLAVAQEAQLWVAKNVEVAGYVIAGVSDAGGLAVKGLCTAKAVIVTDSEMVSFGKKPKALVIARSEGILDEDEFPKVATFDDALVAPFNEEDVEHEALVKAAKKGTTLLR